MTTAGLAYSPGGLHRLGRAVRGAALSGAGLATVSPGRAVSVLSGGLALVPEHSLEDVDAGSVPEPDVAIGAAFLPAAARHQP